MTLKILRPEDVYGKLQEPLPQDRMAPITAVLHERFSAHLVSGEFFQASGKKNSLETYLKIELLEPDDKGMVFEFFVALPVNNAQDDAPFLPTPLLDFADHALQTYFSESREAFLPLDFTPFLVEDQDIYARQEYRNYGLEKAADQWLGDLPEAKKT